MFSRCKDDFGYLGLVLVCFIINGYLEQFLEGVTIHFHALPFALPLMLPYCSGSFVPFPVPY